MKRRKLKKGIKKMLIRIMVLTFVFSMFFFCFLYYYKDDCLKRINRDIVKELDYQVDLLMLVNYENKILNNYDLRLSKIGEDEVAAIIINDLRIMIRMASLDGVELVINNGYRSHEIQEKIYNSYTDDYQKRGYSYEDAVTITKKSVSVPGYSEHETGLAIDFSEKGNSYKNETMWKWLEKNAYKYGFILRYPDDKIDITKIKYEPWHYRYVGKENAKKIYDLGATLEEYMAL